MGEVEVPANALYGAQTQRAVNNFQISGQGFTNEFLEAVALVKYAAADVNAELGALEREDAEAIKQACELILRREYLDQFPVDVYQTGSGTSTNMNVNEVIAKLANDILGEKRIHPNNHVNFGQSSNDVIPTAIRISTALQTERRLLPALEAMQASLLEKAQEFSGIVKTGRTHLMDAMPVTFEQVFQAYASQLEQCTERLVQTLPRLCALPQGGTAVGSGVNRHPAFASKVAHAIGKKTGMHFTETKNHIAAQGTADVPLELSGQLKSVAMALYKLCNDLRWMNSGPNNGLGEIQLKALQPGSSIMPAKVNPVMEEAMAMVCSQVVGFDSANTMAAASSQFELNVMQPLLAHNLLEAIRLLSNGCDHLREFSVQHIQVNKQHVEESLDKNPILVTALNPLIGYDLAAKVAKKALSEKRALIDVALEMTDLSKHELEQALDPLKMTQPGI
ncbi:fumarate hydratase [Oceanobacter sp. RED65]|uniref:fumarate hydratase n=2 Tax=Bermanella marisrubri TaxID=207949 RepID=Q1N1S0_9GAMM|nr:fumarate hydratase [Oceanobacter sp. RED65] [Bermanella marisrubri]